MNFFEVSPSYWLDFMNSSSMGPFDRVQSFRNRLLQCGSPRGSQVLPTNLLQHGLLSPQVLPGACSSVGSLWCHSLLRAATCSSMGSSTGCRGTTCLTVVFSMGCRGISAPAPKAPPPPPSPLTSVSAELVLSHILTLLSLLLLFHVGLFFFSS